MFKHLLALFSDGVLVAYENYTEVRDSDTAGRSRHTQGAIQAAAQLFHFREHFSASQRKTRRQVIRECPDYRLIADVTNAAKHAVVTRPTSEGPALVSSADDIQNITYVTQFEDEEGIYPDARTLVFVKCTDGVSRNLDDALTNVLNYWGAELKRLGYTDFKPRPLPEPPGSRFLKRDEVRALNFEARSGVPWGHACKLMNFDSATGKSTPVDLTGSKITMRIYKPPKHVLSVVITPPDERAPILVDIPLTDDQTIVFMGLKTESARNEFMNKIAVENQTAINERLRIALAAE